MSLKKKIGIAMVAMVIAVVLGSFYSFHRQGAIGNKEVSITIIDDTTKETLYEQVIQSDAQTLAQLLAEQTQLKASIETSSYGGLLTSLLDLKQDMKKGPWWLYTSENNTACIEQSMCPAIDQVPLGDQDAFTFTYTMDIGF